MNVKSFVEEIKPKIEEQLRKEVAQHENGETIAKVIAHGKRLRPLVSILSYKLAGGKEEVKALQVAAAVELAHGASLLKDEIIDKDKQRRGDPALWVKEGPTTAMATADQMIQVAVRSALAAGKNVFDTLMGGWGTAWQGEKREVSFMENLRHMPSPTLQGYYSYIGEKTGSLFGTAAKMGAEAAGTTGANADTFYNWAYQLGVLYQLADDYVDINKGKAEVFPFLAIAQIEEQMKAMLFDGILRGRFTPLDAFARAGIDTPRFYQEKIADAKIRVQSLFTALPANPEYSAVAASLGDYMVEQMMQELQQPQEAKDKKQEPSSTPA